MGTLQVGGTTLGVKNTSTNKVDLSNVGDVTLTSSANIKGAINASGDAPIYACRAWVHFDGTKDTSGSASTANTNRLINGSGNVASVLRNGTGKYTITFTTPMPDVNYSIIGMFGATDPTSSNRTVHESSSSARTVNNVTVRSMSGSTSSSNASYVDADKLSFAIFR